MAKTRMSLNAIALEGERFEAEQQGPMATDEQDIEEVQNELRSRDERDELEVGITEVEEVGPEIDDEADERQAEAFALESLHMFGSMLRHQIASGTVTNESVNAIQMGVQNVYASMGVRVKKIGFEHAHSAAAYGQFVLESMALESTFSDSSFLSKIGTTMGTIVGKVSSTHTLYEHRIEQLTQKLNASKGQMAPFKFNIATNIASSWQFFSTDQGVVLDVAAAAQKDAQLSHYIFTQYGPQAVAELEKLIQILSSGNLENEQSAKAMALAVEKLKSPAELFSQQFLTGEKKPYFGVTGIDIQVGAQRQPLTIGGASLTRLAELASAKVAVEKGSFKHKVKSALGLKWKGENRDFTPENVEQFLKTGEVYNQQVGASVEYFKKAEAASNKAFEVCEALQKKTAQEFTPLFNQLVDVMTVFAHAVFSPARDEQTRAMQGALHCLWLVIDGIDQSVKAGKKAKGGSFFGKKKPGVDNEHSMDDDGNVYDKDGNITDNANDYLKKVGEID